MGTKLCVCPAMGCVCCNNIALSPCVSAFRYKGICYDRFNGDDDLSWKISPTHALSSVEPGRG